MRVYPARRIKEAPIITEQAKQAKQAKIAWTNAMRQMRAQPVEFALARQRWQAAMDGTAQPWPLWFPCDQRTDRANISQFCRRVGLESFAAMYEWSITHRGEFWAAVVDQLAVKFQHPPSQTLNLNDGVTSPRWLEGARWNITESCFQRGDGEAAVIYGDSGGALSTVTIAELRRDTLRVAQSLREAGFVSGDAIAIMMPMNYESIMIYLGIIAAGCAVVSIADSFAAPEIRKRLEIANAKAIICQRSFVRAGKVVDLWSRVADARPPRAIVIGNGNNDGLRDNDLAWKDFLSGPDAGESSIGVVQQGSSEVINILFSSGTTGDPKAIPWNQTTSIKCAADGYFHHDIHAGDVIAWPTNLGWMMGPWLIFAALMNRATIALYNDAPVDEAFGRFVQDAKVTMLGVVPTLVRAWRASRCMEGLDWSAIRCFSSTGEASSSEDMFYLSWLAGFKPIIEYCGGTEIGGGYITSTVVQPNVAGAFSTPAVGSQFLIAKLGDEEGAERDSISETNEGPLFLVPPTMGLSTTLLNRDHDATYYQGLPRGPHGETLRRHGDYFRRLQGDFGVYFVAGGRVDDTMNLGGIKVSSAEIEKVLNRLDAVKETAAIAVPAQDTGPDQLIVFAVLADDHGSHSSADLLTQLNSAIRAGLNPLFKVADVVITKSLPRTASNKVMRRKLRDQYRQHLRSS